MKDGKDSSIPDNLFWFYNIQQNIVDLQTGASNYKSSNNFFSCEMICNLIKINNTQFSSSGKQPFISDNHQWKEINSEIVFCTKRLTTSPTAARWSFCMKLLLRCAWLLIRRRVRRKTRSLLFSAKIVTSSSKLVFTRISLKNKILRQHNTSETHNIFLCNTPQSCLG